MTTDPVPPVYDIEKPGSPLPLIFDSPHSGRDYPADFRFACPADLLRRAEDNHVDELLSGVTAHGASLLSARFPRTYIDANRAATDIDPALLAERWHGARPTSRSHAGIGLIRRLARPGVPVYDRKLGVKEVAHRIDAYYKPYHAALEALIGEAHYAFGESWHINCHSMPSPPNRMGAPDFVIGDRDGTSSGRDFTGLLYDTLRAQGYRVALNHPYKGVEILRRHGDPARGRHSVQLEIGKWLYWDEARNEKSDGFSRLQAILEDTAKACAAYIQGRLPTAMAAD